LGDARVTIPSRTRSRRAGFTCSLASQSGTRESNSACPAPKAGGAPCTMSQVSPSSSSRTSLSPSSAERCHRVSCRGIAAPRVGYDPTWPE